jgi:penicillin-binding protein activator
MNKLKMRSAGALILLTAVAVGAGCTRQVTRMAPEQAIDLSGRWNDVDSRLVADALIQQSFESPYGPNWALRFAQHHGGRPPVVIVGQVRNRSMEHIPVGTFVRDMERAYLNSGIVQVVAGGGERLELRAEREDQQDHARAETRARLGAETGATYMLTGEIQSIEDREGNRAVVFYQVDVTLVDLQSNERVWAGNHRIKKYIRQPRLGL